MASSRQRSISESQASEMRQAFPRGTIMALFGDACGHPGARSSINAASHRAASASQCQKERCEVEGQARRCGVGGGRGPGHSPVHLSAPGRPGLRLSQDFWAPGPVPPPCPVARAPVLLRAPHMDMRKRMTAKAPRPSPQTLRTVTGSPNNQKLPGAVIRNPSCSIGLITTASA